METIIRGATTIDRNNKTAMQDAVLEMYDCILNQNNLNVDEISCIVFACTKDLTCGNPATFLRLNREKISNIPWSKINKDTYLKYQEIARKHLDIPFYAEFIIWNNEIMQM